MNGPRRPNPATPDRMSAVIRRDPAPGVEPTRRPAAPRVRPVRITVDLEPTEHKAAKRLALDLDAPSLAAVVRALLTLTTTDPQLADRVRDQLEHLTD